MLVSDYRYGLLLFRKDGSTLGSAPVTVDWEPAAESARFGHARRGGAPLNGEGTASIEPLWDRTEGEGISAGFEVRVESGPSAAEAGHALAALSVAGRRCAGEMEVLRDGAAAGIYRSARPPWNHPSKGA